MSNGSSNNGEATDKKTKKKGINLGIAKSSDDPKEMPQNELDRLREILVGPEARAADDRINSLDHRIAQVERELSTKLNSDISNATSDYSQKIENLKQELVAKYDEEIEAHKNFSQQKNHSLSARIDQQTTDQSARLLEVQNQFTERLDKLAADTMKQMRAIQKELDSKITEVNRDLSERIRETQKSGREQNESLRNELLGLAGKLEDKKISRSELGQILTEISLRMQNNE